MSSEEFWFGDPQDFFLYEDAFVREKKRQEYLTDCNAWLLGLYVGKAFADVYSKAWGKGKSSVYPKIPFEEKRRREEENKNRNPLFAKFLAIKEMINAGMAKKHKND